MDQFLIEPELPWRPAMPGTATAQENSEDPFRDLPVAHDVDDNAAPPATADAGGVLDELALTLEQSRRAQRRYLRGSWVNGTWIGDALHLDQPDDGSAPIAPAPSPAPGSSSGRPPLLTLVPEPDTGAPPTNADDARTHILANPPRRPPTSWEPLQTPVQVYFWDPFGSQWTRVGDGNGTERAKPGMLKPLVLLMLVSFDFPVVYGLLHTSRGTEVIRAVKNASPEPSGNEHLDGWRTIGAGVSRLWTPQYTFYARTFLPGEALRFDIGEGAKSEAGALEADTADPFFELRAQRTHQGTFEEGNAR
jgi:hypothetical protein